MINTQTEYVGVPRKRDLPLNVERVKVRLHPRQGGVQSKHVDHHRPLTEEVFLSRCKLNPPSKTSIPSTLVDSRVDLSKGPVEVTVYKTDLPKIQQKCMGDGDRQLMDMIESLQRRNIEEYMARASSKRVLDHDGNIKPFEDWSMEERQLLAKYTGSAEAEWYTFAKRSVPQLERVEIIEDDLPPPPAPGEEDLDRTAKAINRAMGGNGGGNDLMAVLRDPEARKGLRELLLSDDEQPEPKPKAGPGRPKKNT